MVTVLWDNRTPNSSRMFTAEGCQNCILYALETQRVDKSRIAKGLGMT